MATTSTFTAGAAPYIIEFTGRTGFLIVSVNTSGTIGGIAMTKLKIEVVGEALNDADRYARSKGSTLETLVAEWIELVCERPDQSMRILREMAGSSMSLPELDPELADLARRAGIERRRKRLGRPTVSFNRASGPEETSQDMSGLGASGGAVDGCGFAGGMSVGAGAAGNGPAF